MEAMHVAATCDARLRFWKWPRRKTHQHIMGVGSPGVRGDRGQDKERAWSPHNIGGTQRGEPEGSREGHGVSCRERIPGREQGPTVLTLLLRTQVLSASRVTVTAGSRDRQVEVPRVG